MAEFCHPEFGCDCNEEELKKLLSLARDTIRGLADQQAMYDDWYVEPLLLISEALQ